MSQIPQITLIDTRSATRRRVFTPCRDAFWHTVRHTAKRPPKPNGNKTLFVTSLYADMKNLPARSRCYAQPFCYFCKVFLSPEPSFMTCFSIGRACFWQRLLYTGVCFLLFFGAPYSGKSHLQTHTSSSTRIFGQVYRHTVRKLANN